MSDAFDVLGVPARFDIDQAAVQAAWLRAAAALHPDRFSDPIAQAEVARQAARANDARATLLDDEKRAAALLQRLGGAPAGTEKTVDPEFLMEVLDVRSRLDEALASQDRATIDDIAAWASHRQDALRAELTQLFAAADDAADTARTDALRSIRIALNAWPYLRRMLDAIRDRA